MLKLKILKVVAVIIIIPWFGFATYLAMNDHWVLFFLVIFVPIIVFFIIVGAIKSLFKRFTHPPRR